METTTVGSVIATAELDFAPFSKGVASVSKALNDLQAKINEWALSVSESISTGVTKWNSELTSFSDKLGETSTDYTAFKDVIVKDTDTAIAKIGELRGALSSLALPTGGLGLENAISNAAIDPRLRSVERSVSQEARVVESRILSQTPIPVIPAGDLTEAEQKTAIRKIAGVEFANTATAGMTSAQMKDFLASYSAQADYQGISQVQQSATKGRIKELIDQEAKNEAVFAQNEAAEEKASQDALRAQADAEAKIADIERVRVESEAAFARTSQITNDAILATKGKTAEQLSNDLKFLQARTLSPTLSNYVDPKSEYYDINSKQLRIARDAAKASEDLQAKELADAQKEVANREKIAQQAEADLQQTESYTSTKKSILGKDRVALQQELNNLEQQRSLGQVTPAQYAGTSQALRQGVAQTFIDEQMARDFAASNVPINPFTRIKTSLEDWTHSLRNYGERYLVSPGRNLMQMGGRLMYTTALPIFGSIAGGLMYGANVQQSAAYLRTQVLGENQPSTQEIERMALALASGRGGIPISPNNMLQAGYFLQSAGFLTPSGQQASYNTLFGGGKDSIFSHILRFTYGQQLDPTTAINSLVPVFSAFHLGMSKTNLDSVLNMIASTIARSRITPMDITTNLGRISGMASQRGLSLPQTLGLMTYLTNFLPARQATTATETMLQSIGNKPQAWLAVAKEASKLGYQGASGMVPYVMTPAGERPQNAETMITAFGGFIDWIKNNPAMRSHAAEITDVLSHTLVPSIRGSQALAFLSQSGPTLAGVTAGITGDSQVQGRNMLYLRDYRDMLDTIHAKWQLVLNDIGGFITNMANMPIVTTAISGIAGIFGRLASSINDMSAGGKLELMLKLLTVAAAPFAFWGAGILLENLGLLATFIATLASPLGLVAFSIAGPKVVSIVSDLVKISSDAGGGLSGLAVGLGALGSQMGWWSKQQSISILDKIGLGKDAKYIDSKKLTNDVKNLANDIKGAVGGTENILNGLKSVFLFITNPKVVGVIRPLTEILGLGLAVEKIKEISKGLSGMIGWNKKLTPQAAADTQMSAADLQFKASENQLKAAGLQADAGVVETRAAEAQVGKSGGIFPFFGKNKSSEVTAAEDSVIWTAAGGKILNSAKGLLGKGGKFLDFLAPLILLSSFLNGMPDLTKAASDISNPHKKGNTFGDLGKFINDFGLMGGLASIWMGKKFIPRSMPNFIKNFINPEDAGKGIPIEAFLDPYTIIAELGLTSTSPGFLHIPGTALPANQRYVEWLGSLNKRHQKIANIIANKLGYTEKFTNPSWFGGPPIVGISSNLTNKQLFNIESRLNTRTVKETAKSLTENLGDISKMSWSEIFTKIKSRMEDYLKNNPITPKGFIDLKKLVVKDVQKIQIEKYLGIDPEQMNKYQKDALDRIEHFYTRIDNAISEKEYYAKSGKDLGSRVAGVAGDLTKIVMGVPKKNIWDFMTPRERDQHMLHTYNSELEEARKKMAHLAPTQANATKFEQLAKSTIKIRENIDRIEGKLNPKTTKAASNIAELTSNVSKHTVSLIHRNMEAFYKEEENRARVFADKFVGVWKRNIHQPIIGSSIVPDMNNLIKKNFNETYKSILSSTVNFSKNLTQTYSNLKIPDFKTMISTPFIDTYQSVGNLTTTFFNKLSSQFKKSDTLIETDVKTSMSKIESSYTTMGDKLQANLVKAGAHEANWATGFEKRITKLIAWVKAHPIDVLTNYSSGGLPGMGGMAPALGSFVQAQKGLETFGTQCLQLVNGFLRAIGKPTLNYYDASQLQGAPGYRKGLKGLMSGDVLVWGANQGGAGGFGHTSVFAYATKGGFYSFDENWPEGSPAHLQFHPWKTERPTGYIPEDIRQTAGQGGGGINWGSVPTQVRKYSRYIMDAARATGISPALLAADMMHESGGINYQTSPTGAQGLMQFEPGSWASFTNQLKRMGLSTNVMNAKSNIMAAALYFKQLLSKYGGSLDAALTGYSGGYPRADYNIPVENMMKQFSGNTDPYLGMGGAGTPVWNEPTNSWWTSISSTAKKAASQKGFSMSEFYQMRNAIVPIIKRYQERYTDPKVLRQHVEQLKSDVTSGFKGWHWVLQRPGLKRAAEYIFETWLRWHSSSATTRQKDQSAREGYREASKLVDELNWQAPPSTLLKDLEALSAEATRDYLLGEKFHGHIITSSAELAGIKSRISQAEQTLRNPKHLSAHKEAKIQKAKEHHATWLKKAKQRTHEDPVQMILAIQNKEDWVRQLRLTGNYDPTYLSEWSLLLSEDLRNWRAKKTAAAKSATLRGWVQEAPGIYVWNPWDDPTMTDPSGQPITPQGSMVNPPGNKSPYGPGQQPKKKHSTEFNKWLEHLKWLLKEHKISEKEYKSDIYDRQEMNEWWRKHHGGGAGTGPKLLTAPKLNQVNTFNNPQVVHHIVTSSKRTQPIKVEVKPQKITLDGKVIHEMMSQMFEKDYTMVEREDWSGTW